MTNPSGRARRFRRGRTLARFARPYTRRAIVAAFTLVMATGATVAGPVVAKQVIDSGIRTGDYSRVVLWVAVFLAFISAIVNVGFLAAYPIWSSMMIGLDILVMWAVIVHGREMKSLR